MSTGLYVDITALSSFADADVVACKNDYCYNVNNLYPMREDEFEGVPALIPNAVARILSEEYTMRVLSSTYYKGHVVLLHCAVEVTF